ncbi:MAG: glycoprotein gp100 [Parcubacteria group bacterium Gr01-1014_44]|nr:MAG: glycoprotein gp100 [Parcubacteria group bacterium Gr01-1014_44]
MKLLIIIILAAVMALTGFWMFENKQTVLPVLADQTYIITPLENEVFLKNPGENDFEKIESTREIFEKSEIKTSSTGRALLLYPNGSMATIDKNSHLVIAILKAKGNQSRLDLILGGVLARLKNIVGSDDFYEVKTGNSVAAVRGTILGVRFSESITSVLVLENQAEITPLDPKTGQPIKEAGISLKEGEKTTIDSANLPSAEKPMQAQALEKIDLEDDFIRKNMDEEMLKKPAVRAIFEKSKVKIPSVSHRPRFEDLLKEIKLNPEPQEQTAETPKPTPIPTPIPTPTPTLTPKINLPTATPRPLPTETSKPTGSSEAISAPTPIPPLLESVVPRLVSSGQKTDVIINGQRLKGVKRVLLNDFPVSFFALDELSIFATVPADFSTGVYGITVVLSSGEELKLADILTIK